MEQLKEVLKYKFWILLGVGLILTFTGWWMATGALAATIKTRKDVLGKVEGSIPSSPQSIPNDSWSAQLAKINDQQQAMVTAASRELWERQKARMFWPPIVDDFAKKIAYRGEFATEARELYRTNYEIDAERIWRLIRPVSKFDGTGIVDFPSVRFPMRRWGELAPTSAEMWDSQEDLWLLEPLLEAIRDLNGDELATRLDAAVYSIERLELVGGQRGQAISAPTSSQGMDGGGLMGDAGSLGSPMLSGSSGSRDMMGGGGMGGGSLAGAKFIQVSADFNYREEFGDGGDPPWKAARGGGNMGMAMGLGEGANSFSEGGATQSTPAESNYRRYIDDDAALPYKTRGFYLSVVMDHRRVPELIAALTANGKSDWPVEIVRVQVARLNSDDKDMGPETGGSSGSGPMNYDPSMASSELVGSADGLNGGGIGSFAEGSGIGLDGGPTAAQGFASETRRPDAEDDDLGLPRMPNPNAASFQNVLRDPYVAKVALCGVIYIYNPVEPPPAAEPSPSTPAEGAPTDAAAPAEMKPEEAAPTDGTAPAEGTPAQPADPAAAGEPAAPPATESTPPASPTPPATPPASPTESPPQK